MSNELETTKTLALPCLLLDWRDATPEDVDSGGRRCDHVCEYKLLLPVADHDCRQVDKLPYIEVKLGSTLSTGPAPDRNTVSGLSTPFRDGVHAMRDAVAMRLPLYVRYREICHFVSLHPHDYVRYGRESPRSFTFGQEANP